MSNQSEYARTKAIMIEFWRSNAKPIIQQFKLSGQKDKIPVQQVFKRKKYVQEMMHKGQKEASKAGDKLSGRRAQSV